MSSENTRRFKRLKTNYLLKCRSAAEAGEEFVYNLTDLSASGLRFWSDKFFQESSLIHLSFLMPPLSRSFDLLGRVVRTRKYQGEDPKDAPIYYIAVGFLDMPSRDQAQLNDFIEKIAHDKSMRGAVDDSKHIKRRTDENP